MPHVKSPRKQRSLQSIIAPQKLRRMVVCFLQPILTRLNGRLCMHVSLRKVSLIIPIECANEILDVCCMCCNGLVSLSLLMYVAPSRAHRALHDFFMQNLCYLRAGFGPAFESSMIVCTLMCAPPLSRFLVLLHARNALFTTTVTTTEYVYSIDW
jgi:hypothetical protein